MASESVVLTLTKLDGTVLDVAASVATLQCFVQSRPVQIHPQGRECYIDGVRFEITEQANLDEAYFKIGWSDTLDGSINWYEDPDGNSEFSLADADTVFDVRLEGRFLHFQVYDDQISQQWKLSAVELYGRPVKGRRY